MQRGSNRTVVSYKRSVKVSNAQNLCNCLRSLGIGQLVTALTLDGSILIPLVSTMNPAPESMKAGSFRVMAKDVIRTLEAWWRKKRFGSPVILLSLMSPAFYWTGSKEVAQLATVNASSLSLTTLSFFRG